MQNWLEREEQELCRCHEAGELTDEQLADELKALHREYHMQAEEEAQAAYDDAMNRYYW